MHPKIIIVALFIIAKIWKQLKCPSADGWIGNIHKGHIYIMEYYPAIKMSKVMPFAATWMDLEIITQSEVSQKEKDKHHMIPLICRT